MSSSSSSLCALALALLASSLVTAAPTQHSKIFKRAPAYDVLRGSNFPDPSIINVNGKSYAFGTVSSGMEVPMASNPDFNDVGGWSGLSDAFPSANVPAFDNWAAANTVWAPDVNQLTDFDGSFAMYYSPALKSNNNIHCIGLARSSTIEGPYNDSSTEPWVCPEADGGAIDASGFLDSDNSRYVLYKIDGPAAHNGGYCASTNNIVTNTSIMLQRTQSDGYTKIGSPVSIWNNQGVSDHYQTEAPSLVKNGDTYFLFFSTGCYSDNSYTTKYVTSSNVNGPYGNPQTLLQQGSDGLYGPGGADVTPTGGQMVFHSLVNNDINQGRVMDTATLTFSGGSVSMN
ncbi:glycoside hydrolase family 43 [Lecanosticta acicola]|uniref:Glycoside hydrolase family 43 n=1 Tax=Lecanosticta acicola TaxID=111012 RepID=A0AAI8Z1F2_9PEZI|nr:glycoside hydrolase family 43 [Lecanosticta acicola]